MTNAVYSGRVLEGRSTTDAHCRFPGKSHCALPLGPEKLFRSSPQPDRRYGVRGLAAVVLSRVCPKGRDEGAPLTGSGRPRIISRRVEGEAPDVTLSRLNRVMSRPRCLRPASAWRRAG